MYLRVKFWSTSLDLIHCRFRVEHKFVSYSILEKSELRALWKLRLPCINVIFNFIKIVIRSSWNRFKTVFMLLFFQLIRFKLIQLLRLTASLLPLTSCVVIVRVVAWNLSEVHCSQGKNQQFLHAMAVTY
jgi:hypothetical protein